MYLQKRRSRRSSRYRRRTCRSRRNESRDVRKHEGSKPTAIDGQANAQWVAMDYSDVIVHVFLPDVREFYNLEHLWADAKLERIPDLD